MPRWFFEPPGPTTSIVASRHDNTTMGSDGCVATHSSVQPKIAMSLVASLARSAARAGLALVARPRQRCVGAEVRASRFLQHIAAERRAVADLRRCGAQARLGQRGRFATHRRICLDLGERRERADAQMSPSRRMPSTAGTRPMSTTRSGAAMPSRIQLSSSVPPAMNAAVSAAPSRELPAPIVGERRQSCSSVPPLRSAPARRR